jgi:hypothetical protein
MIDARSVVFPARTHELSAVTLAFGVPPELVRGWLPGEAFELVEAEPGTVYVILALHDFGDGDWGACATCDICLPVRPVGAGPDAGLDGVYVCDALINRRFNSEVAYWSMGIARRFATIEVVRRAGGVTFLVAEGTDLTLEVRVPPEAEAATSATLLERLCYAYLDGEPYVVPFDIEFPDTVLDPASIQVDVGTGPLAATLSSLGVPRPPDLAAWGTGLACTFHTPYPYAGPTGGR